MRNSNGYENLFNIFQEEKKRVGNEFTLFYNKLKNSLQYRADEGTLTVLFNEKEGKEEFYYREKNIGKGIGELIQTNSNYGEDILINTGINIPAKFKKIANDYLAKNNRNKIGVGIKMSNEDTKKNISAVLLNDDEKTMPSEKYQEFDEDQFLRG